MTLYVIRQTKKIFNYIKEATLQNSDFTFLNNSSSTIEDSKRHSWQSYLKYQSYNILAKGSVSRNFTTTSRTDDLNQSIQDCIPNTKLQTYNIVSQCGFGIVQDRNLE